MNATATAPALIRPAASLTGAAATARLMSRNQDQPGDRMRARREELKLTAQQVGAHMNLSRPAYSQYETNTSKLTGDKAILAAQILDVTPEWIMFGVGEKEALALKRFDGRKFVDSSKVVLPEAWLKAHYGYPARDLDLYIVTSDTKTMKTGDIAVLKRGRTLERTPSEYVYVFEGDACIGQLSEPKPDTVRVHKTKGHTDYDPFDVQVYGRVLGSIS